MATKAWERQPDESTKAFEAFAVYRDLGANRSIEKVAQTLSKSDQLIKRWSYTYGWVQRVTAYDDYIDAEARKRLDREAIRRKADMLRRHAEVGRVLQGKGLEYLRQHGVDRGADAITAIIKGVDTERKSEGLPEYLIEVMEASNDDLARQYNELLAQIGGTGSGNEEAGNAPAGSDTASNSPPTE